MSDTPKRDLSAIGQEILFAARNELYMNLPYLDVVLCGRIRPSPLPPTARPSIMTAPTLLSASSGAGRR